MSHFYLQCCNYKWLDNPFVSNLTNITTVEENGPKEWFFQINGEMPGELHVGKGLCFPIY